MQLAFEESLDLVFHRSSCFQKLLQAHKGKRTFSHASELNDKILVRICLHLYYVIDTKFFSSLRYHEQCTSANHAKRDECTELNSEFPNSDAHSTTKYLNVCFRFNQCNTLYREQSKK